MTLVHVLLPDMVDDARRPSGGSSYDRRVVAGLEDLGWTVREHVLAGPWPDPAGDSLRRLRAVVERIPDGSTILVDGIVASATPDVLVPASRRLRLVVLLHLPLGETLPATGDVAGVRMREAAVLSAADAVVVTGAWTRERVLARYGLDPTTVHVAEPGVDRSPLAVASRTGSRLLQVGAVSGLKGQDVLLAALAAIDDLDWTLRLVGSTDVDPGYAARVAVAAARWDGRVVLTGALVGDAIAGELAAADLVVVPSRTETYGMVVTEALARGIPVVATEVGGLPTTLRGPAATELPGLLVAPDDGAALGAALRRWLEDETLRARLRAAARARRTVLRGWETTARAVAQVLADVADPRREAVAR